MLKTSRKKRKINFTENMHVYFCPQQRWQPKKKEARGHDEKLCASEKC